MAKRKIIKIDKEKCNGCGLCIPNCPEGALQIIDGKVRLISDLFCDGLGACIDHCPEGAITTEERDAQPYDEKKVMGNIVKQGENTIKAHLKHLKEHGEHEYLKQAHEYLKEKNIKIPVEETKETLPCGCPGTMMKDFRVEKIQTAKEPAVNAGRSQLRQWPVQLRLLNPHAPYFKNADLLIVADCIPFTYPDFHNRFLKNKIVVIFCPKLDQASDMYIEKLKEIFIHNNIKSITLVHMEVPCCFGLAQLTEEALKQSGKNIAVKEYTVSIKGEIV